MPEIAVVTGASGYIASELVKQLLEKGYNVRGTVRSVANKEKTAHLTALGEALPGNLTLHEADLLKPGSFDEIVKGAHFVFHTASPFLRTINDPQKDLVEPALHGTENVLGSVAKHKATVERVVVTSSFAAIINTINGPPKPPRYDEESWNKDSTLENGAVHLYNDEEVEEKVYLLYELYHSKSLESKVTFLQTLAEQAAWKLSKEHGFELAVINPTFVLGPILSARTDATSIMNVKDVIEGTRSEFAGWVCDVRDIARAHVLAIENEAAKGHRFLVSQPDTYNAAFFSKALQKAFPDLKIKDLPETSVKPILDNTKALKVLGLGQLYDPAESIVDMARTLIQKGVANPQRK